MSNTALQIDALWSGITNPTNGKAYSGAIVATFASGTSTAKAVWQDKEKTLPSALGQSQFTLDSNGQAFVFGDGVYKISVYAPTDTGLTSPLFTIDGAKYNVDLLPVFKLSEFENFTAAVAGSTGELWIDEDGDLTEDIVVSDTLALRPINGNTLGGAHTLTVSLILAGDYQIFETELTVAGLNRSNILWFGADKSGAVDSSDNYDAAIAGTLEGGTIDFPFGTYKGHFTSLKAFTLVLNGSEFTPTSADTTIISFSKSVDLRGTLQSNVGYGDKDLLLQAGEGAGLSDLNHIYLEDEKEKSGSRINRELLVAHDITGGAIVVEDMVRSEMNEGVISCYKVFMLLLPRIIGGGAMFNLEDTLTNPAVFIQHSVDAYVEDIKCSNQNGNFLRFQYCDNWKAKNIIGRDAYSTDENSGAYVVRAAHCRNGNAYNCVGERVRHTIDFLSSYNCSAHDTSGNANSSSEVVLAHTGYGGNNNAYNTKSFGESDRNSAIVWGDNTMSGLYGNLIARDVTIENTKMLTSWTPDEKVHSVDIQAALDNGYIKNSSMFHTDQTGTPSTDNAIVNCAGVTGRGAIIDGVFGNKVGVGVAAIGDGEFSYNTLSINNVKVDIADTPIRIFGVFALSVDNLSVDSCVGSALVSLNVRSGITPTYFTMGNYVYKNASAETSVAIVSRVGFTSLLIGSGPYNQTLYENVIASTDMVLTEAQVLRNMGNFRLRGDSIADKTMNAVAPIVKPLWRGQRFRITMDESDGSSARHDVIIPAVNDTVWTNGINTITLVNGNIYELNEENEKWAIRDLGAQLA